MKIALNILKTIFFTLAVLAVLSQWAKWITLMLFSFSCIAASAHGFYKGYINGRWKKMTQKEKLIGLLDEAIISARDNYGMPFSEDMADFLLGNGVYVSDYTKIAVEI